MATIEIAVWIDDDGNVFSKKMLDEVINEKVTKELKSRTNFDDFICDCYSLFDLFTMNEEARAEMWKQYEAQVREWIDEEIEDCYRKQVIEIDIDTSK